MSRHLVDNNIKKNKFMKLIIQIPCYNEEESLPVSFKALPKQIPGISTIETLIIDDGSTDHTVRVAKELGVDHIVRFNKNKGLAKGFMAGLDRCLKEGADIIVNTDADNQYCADDIEKLVQPILDKKADIVIGTRPIDNIKHFSPVKKMLQKLGSWVVRAASNTNVQDAPSGFRAISADAAMQLNVFNEYTYTLETIIQAGQKNMAIMSVPIRVNGDLRPSRLVKSISSYVVKSIGTILRIFITYRPVKFFSTIGSILFMIGFLLGIRWLMLYFLGTDRAHVPSLVLASILMLSGFMSILAGVLSDIIASNRKLLEEIQYKIRKMEYTEYTESKDSTKNKIDSL
jgi:glycosyltransferase involved in cell wall biosynthesis